MADTALAARIAEVRAFNRFYTALIGVLNEGLLESPFTLAEARILFELFHKGEFRATDLARQLAMDPAQISRIVQRLGDNGMIAVSPGAYDRRTRTVELTEQGRAAAEELDARSNAQIERLLARHAECGQMALTQSMHTIASLFDPSFGEAEVSLRDHRLGELGWLIHRQALIYHEGFGWNAEFEALIARLYADFEMAPESPPKKLWIAEMRGIVAGSVYVVPKADSPETAQLRMLYVEPVARGKGVGTRLVGEAVGFAREAGYGEIMLWTQDCLTSARKIYQAAGFELAEEQRHRSFGQELNGQIWAMSL